MILDPIKMKLTASLLLLTLVLAATPGCGPQGQSRIAVTGKVTLDGQPLPEGQVVFTPQSKGFTAAAPIADGAYSVRAERGPSAGTHLVQITANRPTGRKIRASAYSKDQTPQELTEQYIPARYNDSSELVIEFKDGSPATHNFELKSAATK